MPSSKICCKLSTVCHILYCHFVLFSSAGLPCFPTLLYSFFFLYPKELLAFSELVQNDNNSISKIFTCLFFVLGFLFMDFFWGGGMLRVL